MNSDKRKKQLAEAQKRFRAKNPVIRIDAPKGQHDYLKEQFKALRDAQSGIGFEWYIKSTNEAGLLMMYVPCPNESIANASVNNLNEKLPQYMHESVHVQVDELLGNSNEV